MQIRSPCKRTELYSDKPVVIAGDQRLSDFYRNPEFPECKSSRYDTQEEGLLYYEKYRNDEEAAPENVSCGRTAHLAGAIRFLATIGSILIGGVGWFMKTRISYFVFHYPIKEMVGILLVLLGICMTIPRFLYKQTIEQDK